MRLKLALLLSFAFFSNFCLAQVQRPAGLDSMNVIAFNSSQKDSVVKQNKLNQFMAGLEWYMKYFPIPYFSYSKETNWLFGISKYNAFILDKGDKTDTITQASNINAFGYFTLNNQYKVAIESNLMLNKNKALWRTFILYTDYPLEFFGRGNDTNLGDQRTLITSDWQFSTYYLFKTWRKWYLGPNFDFYNFYDVELEEGAIHLPNDSLNLAHNIGKQSGLGIKLLMEGRDNRLNAKSGIYADVGYQFFRNWLGSEYHYNYFLADFRYYYTTQNQLTFAYQFRTEAKKGEVPVQSLAFLGGDFSMRGTYRGRYRDNVSIDTQLELRFPIYWIFGGVVFNGIGQVAPTYGDMAFNRFHYNYGLGVRVLIDTEHDVNLRFDYGVSSDQQYFVINFAEAF